MYTGGHMGIYRFDFLSRMQPSKKLYGMTAHIHGYPAPRTFHVPEMVRMRTVVLLGLFEQYGFAEGPFIEQGLEPHIFWGKTQLFGVHQLYIGLFAGRYHQIGLLQVHAEGLFDHHMLSSPGSFQADFAM